MLFNWIEKITFIFITSVNWIKFIKNHINFLAIFFIILYYIISGKSKQNNGGNNDEENILS